MQDMQPIMTKQSVINPTRIIERGLKRAGTQHFWKYFLTNSFLGGLGLLFFVKQQMISFRLALILLLSSVRAPTKIVNWSKKLQATPTAAIKQKFFKAGTSVSMPIKKAQLSQRAAVKIDGPISFKA